MNVFKLLETDYVSKFIECNPIELKEEELALINNYKTPSREYLKRSARNISYKDIALDTLEYILSTCHQCSMQDKYEAALVTLHKIAMLPNISAKEIEDSKKELLAYIEITQPDVIDLSYIDDATKGHEDNFFYLVEISIGVNKILKFGITNSNPRKRFSHLKSDIKGRYVNHAIVITPLVLLHAEDSVSFEENFHNKLIENNVIKTKYDFKGTTETFQTKHLQLALELLLPNIRKKEASILYQIEHVSKRYIEKV